MISPACHRRGTWHSQAAGSETNCKGGKFCKGKRDEVDHSCISSLRNLSVPSWATPFLTLEGIRALPYRVFQREGDISEQDNSVGMCVSSKWTEDQGFAFVYSVSAPLCLYLSPGVLCMRFCCRLFGNQEQDVSIWAKIGCTLNKFCLCTTYSEAQKQSVVRQSLSPVLYLDILFVFPTQKWISTQAYVHLWTSNLTF